MARAPEKGPVQLETAARNVTWDAVIRTTTVRFNHSVHQVKVRGKIVHEEIEGGFWGIIDDDGTQYFPVDGLPDGLKTSGCRVEAEVEEANVFTTAMWGQNVRIRHIREL